MATKKKTLLKPISPEEYAASLFAGRPATDGPDLDSRAEADEATDLPTSATSAPSKPSGVPTRPDRRTTRIAPDLVTPRIGRLTNRDQAAFALQEAILTFEGASSVTKANRRAVLEARVTAGPTKDVAKVKPTVVDIIVEMKFKSLQSDATLLSIGTQFARWVIHHNADGEFRPARDLDDLKIQTFLSVEMQDLAKASQATYVSYLRRLRDGGERPNVVSRQRAQPPHDARFRRQLWEAVADMDHWMGVEGKTLLALTFGAGLASSEIGQLRADSVERFPGKKVIAVRVERGQFIRTVPVLNPYAAWLSRRAADLEPDQSLFYPTFNSRKNAVTTLVTQLSKRHEAFADFKANRARHTWLIEALVSGVPFHAVCQAAGVGPGTHLPTDLLPNMPHCTPADLRAAFEKPYKYLA